MMEDQVFHMLAAEILYSLAKKGENVFQMEITRSESQLNSRNELSRFKKLKLQADSTSRRIDMHRIDKDGHKSQDKRSQGNSGNLLAHRGKDDSLASCSRRKDSGNKDKIKGVLHVPELEHLTQRLKFLEEEMESMKQAFIEHVKHRSKLVSEIYQRFQLMQHMICSRNGIKGQRFCEETTILNHPKNEGAAAGLSQVLCEDSNPSLITKELRATSYLSKKLQNVIPHMEDSYI